MLVVKKELGFYDFEEICNEFFKDLERDGLSLIYDYLEEVTESAGMMLDEMELKDFLRFEVEVMTEEEVKNYYDVDEDEEVEEFLSYNTLLIGSYEADNTIYYIFTSF